MQSELKRELGLNDAAFDTHESDLYVIATPEVRSYLRDNYAYWGSCSAFKCQVTGCMMIEIPFGNEYFWNKVAKREACRSA